MTPPSHGRGQWVSAETCGDRNPPAPGQSEVHCCCPTLYTPLGRYHRECRPNRLFCSCTKVIISILIVQHIMKANRDRLYELAERQRGFFTRKQARACGYAPPNHRYHVRTGEWIRERRGIFRLARFPRTDEDQLALWSLWSCGRHEEPQGVYSHQTALSLHELSDVMPSKLHMTVPRRFRRNAPVPRVLVLHKGELQSKEIEEREGYRVVAPLRAIADLLAGGTEDRGQLRRALRQALDRGLVTRRQIDAHPLRKELQSLLGGKSR